MSNLKAVLTFDDSWDDDAVRNAFADNDQFPGVTVAEVTSTECGKCARQIKGSAEQQSAPPTNKQSELRKKTTESLAYIARMQCGTKERIELCRRNKERTSCA